MIHDAEFDAAWDELAARDAGRAPPTPERIPVEQSGRVVGTLPSGFNTRMARSTNLLYDVRKGDLERQGDKIVAHRFLGAGDLASLPGFIPGKEA